MSESEALWKILRCPECEGLMKVDSQNVSGQVACPSCGTMFGGDDPEVAEIQDFPEPTEVITGGGGAQDLQAGTDLPDLDDLALEDELAPVPEAPSPTRPAAAETSIPKPRREEYRVPELISNVGERTWNPGGAASRKEPGFDKSKIASTSDERLAADPEEEEGAVKAHVARKITGWDLEDDEMFEGAAPGQSRAASPLKTRLAMAGIVVVVTLFIGLIVYGVFQSLKEKEIVEREEEKPIEEIAREAMSSVERDVMDRSEETFAAAGEVIEGYLNAKTYQERLGFVRDADRVEPLMKRYYESNPDGPFSFREPTEGWQMRPYQSFLLTTVISQDFAQHPIAVEQREEDGRYMVDWESFVGYCEIPWDEITERKSTEPFLLRARASVGDYYNHGFYPPEPSQTGDPPNKDGWACIKLEDRGQQNTIYGYVKIDDPVLQDLAKVMTPSGSVFITVKVAYPPDGKAANQFLITELVSRGWVFSDEVEPIRSGADGGEE